MNSFEQIILLLIITIIIGCVFLLIMKNNIAIIKYNPFYYPMNISNDNQSIGNQQTNYEKVKTIESSEIYTQDDLLPWDREVTHCDVMKDIDDKNLYKNVRNVDVITFY